MIPYSSRASNAIGAALWMLPTPQAVQLTNSGSGRSLAEVLSDVGLALPHPPSAQLFAANTSSARNDHAIEANWSKLALLDPAGASRLTTDHFLAHPAPWRRVAVTAAINPVSPTWIQGQVASVIFGAAVAQPIAAITPSVGSPLVALIDAELSLAVGGNAEIARAAAADAVAVVQRAKLGGTPRVMLSGDGILTLQWQRGEYGVALIFAGDGITSVAFMRPGQLYAENGIDVPISEDLPAQCRDALARISM